MAAQSAMLSRWTSCRPLFFWNQSRKNAVSSSDASKVVFSSWKSR
ncbi:MAG: hypothetical protein ACRENE_11055 [Polyangiaceae bacterium]